MESKPVRSLRLPAYPTRLEALASRELLAARHPFRLPLSGQGVAVFAASALTASLMGGCGSRTAGVPEPQSMTPTEEALSYNQDYRLPVPFEQLAELAQRTLTTPAPLRAGLNPGELRDGKPWSGTFVWSSHKTAVIVEEYKDGRPDGWSVGYHSKNVKHWEGHYVKGAKEGIFRMWDFNGNLHSTEIYKDGVLVTQAE